MDRFGKEGNAGDRNGWLGLERNAEARSREGRIGKAWLEFEKHRSLTRCGFFLRHCSLHWYAAIRTASQFWFH